MNDQSDTPQSKRWPWWAVFVGPALGVVTSRAMSAYWPHLSGTGHETIIAIAAILIAGLLTYSIYRFARM